MLCTDAAGPFVLLRSILWPVDLSEAGGQLAHYFSMVSRTLLEFLSFQTLNPPFSLHRSFTLLALHLNLSLRSSICA